MPGILQLLTLASPVLGATIGCNKASSRDSSSVSVSVPAACPTDASPIVDPSFPGYAIEVASVVEYATDANGNPNTFSQSLINAINSRTGGKPIIRFGGTSSDFARLIPGQAEPALPVAAADNYQNVGNTTLGPSFWSLFANFPGASFVFQVPLGIDELENAVNWTVSGVQGIGLDRIDAIEIGNEPDIYPNNNAEGDPLLPPEYQGELTNETYVYKFGAFASAVSEALSLPAGPIFQALDTSVHFDSSEAYVFDVATVFGDGLNVNNTIKSISHHYYQTDGSTDLQSGLLDHAAISTHLDYFRPFISYLQTSTNANGAPIPFVLGEVGNSLNSGHDYTYQAVLGSALWAVDFSLYALAIGVSRIYFQQIMHSGFDLWLPIDSAGEPAQTFASFYALPFIADFISTSGTSRVAQLAIPDAPASLVAYTAYEGNTPKRIALVNLNEYDDDNSTATTPRGGQDVTLTGLAGFSNVTVDFLSSPQGAHADASTISYGGSQWTYASGGEEVKGVRADSVTASVDAGSAVVSIPDSSAALVYLNP